jgi:hypothetical protein
VDNDRNRCRSKRLVLLPSAVETAFASGSNCTDSSYDCDPLIVTTSTAATTAAATAAAPAAESTKT